VNAGHLPGWIWEKGIAKPEVLVKWWERADGKKRAKLFCKTTNERILQQRCQGRKAKGRKTGAIRRRNERKPKEPEEDCCKGKRGRL